MIHIKVDSSLIPVEVLEAAQRATAKLETLPENERTDYIKKHAHIWSAFKDSLRAMSFGKCWYSESRESHSFMAVDHFRPKNAAQRSATETDTPGYQWLAFDWTNYRLAADCSNTATKSKLSGDLEGKNEWFPLCDGSLKATWANRDVEERPVLIDPIDEDDVLLVDVADDGRIVPGDGVYGTDKRRVEESSRILGLNHGSIKEAREQKMRDIKEWVEVLNQLATVAAGNGGIADELPLRKVKQLIKQSCSPHAEFSLAARHVVEATIWKALLR